jgi:PAS domain S-box-containing protein
MSAKQTRYQSIFETAIDGVILINEQGLIEDINEAALELFQYEKKELLGKNVSALVPAPHQHSHDGYMQAYQQTGKAKIIGIGREVNGLKKNGEEFPFRLAVSEYQHQGVTYYTGIIHDLTKQKEYEAYIKQYSQELEKKVAERTQLLEQEIMLREEAQQALLKSQKLYETISVNFPNGSITVLNTDLDIVFIEGSELKKFGYGTEKLLGRSYIDLLPTEVVEMVKDHLRAVCNGAERSFEFKIADRTYLARCVPLFGPKNRIEQVLMVETNITPQKQAEEEIYNALQQEKRLNELKTRFVSMASHEFRTPLSSILSSAGLIERYTEKAQNESRLKHLQKIKRNVHNLIMILNDFLSLEKIEGGVIKNKPEEINLKEFIEEVKEEAEAVSKKEQHINCQFAHQQETFLLDTFLLRNTLNNLLSNAIKYSEKDVVVATRQEANKLVISIKDEGIGISKEDQKGLFNRFYRASNSTNIQGTGLGLNIVKRYAQIMDAEVTFESEINKGSTFSLIFNLQEA